MLSDGLVEGRKAADGSPEDYRQPEFTQERRGHGYMWSVGRSVRSTATARRSTTRGGMRARGARQVGARVMSGGGRRTCHTSWSAHVHAHA